jgi:ABC-type multidrug transport system fused ATPase/permease subunit
MASGIFYRNVRARDQLELFLLSAVTSLLLVRFYLYLTGYPQIGSGGLHIAHMLWGGALMLVALVISLSMLGARSLRVAAVAGGIGFGVFIDELGKFITRDNNYFYQPTIGLIYAIFIILYLTFNFLSRRSQLSSREYQLNALSQLEEAIVHDMDPTEKSRVKGLLAKADQNDPVTKQLLKFLSATRTKAPSAPSRANRFVRWLNNWYERFWQRRNSNQLVRVFFLLEVFAFVGSVVWLIYRNIDSVIDLFRGTESFSAELAVGQLVASLFAAGYAIYGATLLPSSRIRAFEQFRGQHWSIYS